MENTNTDARKAAEQFYESQRKLGFTESITSNDSPDYTLPFYQNIFSLMLEFAQYRPATLEKGEVSEKDFGEYLISIGHPIERIISTCLGHHEYPLSVLLGYAKWRESLSEQPEDKCLFCGENFSECGHIRAEEEQPEAKPTEPEQVEKWRKRFIKNLDNAKLSEQGEYNEGFVQGITVGLAIFDEALNSLKQ